MLFAVRDLQISREPKYKYLTQVWRAALPGRNRGRNLSEYSLRARGSLSGCLRHVPPSDSVKSWFSRSKRSMPCCIWCLIWEGSLQGARFSSVCANERNFKIISSRESNMKNASQNAGYWNRKISCYHSKRQGRSKGKSWRCWRHRWQHSSDKCSRITTFRYAQTNW